MFERQMTLTTAHIDNQLYFSDACSLCWSIFFSKTVCSVTGLGPIKKIYETYHQHSMHHFAKIQTNCNSCSKHSPPFCKCWVTKPTFGKFSFAQNIRTTKVSLHCFHAKVRNISKFKCYMRDILIQTSHTIARTCSWPRGENAYRVLIR